MNQQELKNVLELHRKWLFGEDGGCGSNLRGSNLSGSNLRGSNLSDSDLRGSNLSGSNLSDSDLSDSDLSGSNLSDSDLSEIKDDFFRVLQAAKAEVLGLYDALQRGHVDGTQYQGECACLVGTIANVRHENYNELGIDLRPNAGRPAERWFLAIRKGDIPQSNPVSAITAEWIREFMDANAIKYPKYEIVAVSE